MPTRSSIHRNKVCVHPFLSTHSQFIFIDRRKCRSQNLIFKKYTLCCVEFPEKTLSQFKIVATPPSGHLRNLKINFRIFSWLFFSDSTISSFQDTVTYTLICTSCTCFQLLLQVCLNYECQHWYYRMKRICRNLAVYWIQRGALVISYDIFWHRFGLTDPKSLIQSTS